MRKWKYAKTLVPVFLLLARPLLVFTQSNAVDSIINAAEIQKIVAFLAADSLNGRFTGTQEISIAANFIASEFAKAGIQPLNGKQDYLDPFQTNRTGIVGYNVIGSLPGMDDSGEAIIFSAHYDHVGTTRTNPFPWWEVEKRKPSHLRDSIYNGANDNASGTAALICLARYFAHVKNNKRTILFIAFSGEELGLLGSSALATKIKDPGSITCQINLEMLGRGRNPFITGSDLGNLRSILNQELARIDRKHFTKHYFMPERYRDEQLFIRSDNFPFAGMGIPAHTIMVTPDTDPYYHTVNDEASTLDYDLIQHIARAIALSVQPIVDGKITPRRINAYDY